MNTLRFHISCLVTGRFVCLVRGLGRLFLLISLGISNVGDVVLYNVGAAVAVTLDNEQFLIIKDEDILAIVDSEQ